MENREFHCDSIVLLLLGGHHRQLHSEYEGLKRHYSYALLCYGEAIE